MRQQHIFDQTLYLKHSSKLWRLLAIILVAAIILALSTAAALAADNDATEEALTFDDVASGAWYYQYVMWAYQSDLMIGVSEEPPLFAPDMPLSRAMFATILWRVVESPEADDDNNPFPDVLKGAWYYEAVLWAAQNGIVDGYQNGRFGPNDNITREQLAVMMMNFLTHLGVDVATIQEYQKFGDETQIAPWAKEAIKAMNELGVLLGMTDGSFAPKAEATRAQVAAVVQRFMEAILNAVLPDDGDDGDTETEDEETAKTPAGPGSSSGGGGADLEMGISAYGLMEPDSSITLSWLVTHIGGSFEIQVSATDNDADFQTITSGIASVDGVDSYDSNYQPTANDGDLYFRIIQKDGRSSASSNVVKMVKLEDNSSNNFLYVEEITPEENPDDITIAVIGYEDNGNILLEWESTSTEGSFKIIYSEDGINFNDLEEGLDSGDSPYTYTPPGTGDLYFQLIQTDGEDSVASNIVKMIYLEGVGYVQQLETYEDDNAPIVELTEEDEYQLWKKSITINNVAVATVSALIQKKYHPAYEANISLANTALEFTGAMASPWEGSPGFELKVASGFDYPAEGLQLSYQFDDSAKPLGSAYVDLHRIVRTDITDPVTATMDLLYKMDEIGYDTAFINQSYDSSSGLFTATLPAPGRYYVSGSTENIADDPTEENYSETPITYPDGPWQPTSKLAEIIYNAGFAYDPDADLLYAREDAHQHDLGYAYFYDEGISLISSYITCEPMYFIYDDKEWLIEAWKGQYGIELGAEIGVYNRELGGDYVFDRAGRNYKKIVEEIIYQIESKYFSIPSQIKEPLMTVVNNTSLDGFIRALEAAHKVARTMAQYEPLTRAITTYARDTIGAFLFGFRSKLYDCVDQGEYLMMEFDLYAHSSDYFNSKPPIFSRGAEEHWWLTGFDWGAYAANPNSLVMEATIWFPEADMRDAFINGWDDFDAMAGFVNEYMANFSNWSLAYDYYNNNKFTNYGITRMGYREMTNNPTKLNLWEFSQGSQDVNGYPVQMVIWIPAATQPFITTQLGPIVNTNNQILVNIYNNLKTIVGCTSDDPNELEEKVLKYTGSNKDMVRSVYDFISNEIVKVVDMAFSIAKAAMS